MRNLRSIDWRILLGTAITVLWLLGGLLYLAGQGLHVARIPIENLGSFLEGGFAPLAFMWLVIGLFIQQKELADNTAVLRDATRLSERQAEVLAASERSQRQETFFRIADNVKRQLGVIAGMLFISRFGTTEGNIYSVERVQEMWEMLSNGDNEVFEREFLIMELGNYGGEAGVFFGTEIREKHSLNYLQTYERLLAQAKDCDSDGIIEGTVTDTAHGLLYSIIRNARSEVTTSSSALSSA